MKYKLLRLSLLSMLVMFFGGLAFAQDETIDFSALGYDNAAEVTTVQGTDVTLTFDKGTSNNAPKYYTAGTAVRLYGGNTLKVSSSTKTIEKVVFTFSSSSNNLNDPTVDEGSYDSETSTWTGSASEFTITRGGTSGHARIQKMEFYYAAGGETDTRIATSMTLGEHVTTIIVNESTLVPEVTVTDASGAPVAGAAIEWTSSNTDVAVITENIISCEAVGTTTIKAEFIGDDIYKGCSASYTLTVTAEPYTSIAAMLADITATKTNASYKFENLLVTYVNGQNTYVSDGRNGFLFYGSNVGLEAGNIYQGLVTGQLYTYNGLPELAVASIDAVAQSEGNLVAWPTIPVADLQSYINIPVTIEDAVFVEASESNAKNLTFKVGEETLAVYNNWSIDVTALEADKTYTLKGVGSVYAKDETTTYQLYLVSFEEKAEEPEPAGWRDIKADFTNGSFFTAEENQSVISAGLKMNEDGSFTRVAADDETANAVITGKFHSNEHGLANFSATVKVLGTVKVSMGTCAWGGDVTVKNAEGETVATFNTNTGACYHNDKENNIAFAYYKVNEPTTLTISGGSYTPYFAVEAVSPEQIPNDVKFIFDIANSGAEGVAPEAETIAIGKEYTLPKNFTLYKEGFTLTGWTDGENTYAPGETITAPEAEEITLTPIFTENAVSLSDRTEAVTVKWNFRRDQGAPAVGWERQEGLVWVAQAEVNGKSIDVALPFSTNPGKFNNRNNTDWVQINNGTTFTVPSAKGATISMEAYNEITTTTIDGQTDYTHGKTISYTIAGAAETVDVVIGDGSYYRYIQVVLPKVEKQLAGTTFDNVEGTVSWKVGNEASGTATDEIADAVQSALWSTGDEMTITTSTYFESTMVNYKPNNSNAGNVEGVMIEYRVKLAAGLTFKPTSVSYDCVKVGTDGATYSWGYVVDDEASTITDVDAATTLRNNGANSATAQLNHVLDMSNAGEGNAFAIRFYISKTANNKNICIGNVKINGVVNGTIQDVQMFTFAAAAAPAEAGSVNVYPAGESFEAGTELTLTATENFGYDFVNWTDATGTEVSTDAKFTYTVESDAVLTANFVAVNTYELALTVDGTNDYMVKISPAPTMVDGKMMYEAGQAVQLQADQYEGLVTFTNWSDGETNSSKLVSMDGNVSLTAYYAEADIIAGWDFYKAGGSGRKADFASADNEAAALNLVETATGNTSGWLDKSTEAAGGYESFAGAATNWRTGAQNGDVGNWHWQTKLNAADFQDINVQFQMLYNYNAYQRYNAECSLDGENWTKFGDITMTGAKAPASFSRQLPAEANNQAELYIRLIADRTSNIDGTASANDGNTLAMFFITGTPKLVDDGTAPVLVSTVPENGATGASATGKIVLTFDERVKLTDNATATLGNQTLTPAVSGKTVTFEYKGLEYGTDYTFSLPANSIADLTDNYIQEAINLTFTTMVRPSVTKKLYDFIVPDDGTFAEALKAAAARTDKNVRYRIFVKQGDYVIAANQTALVDGNDGNKYADPKTYFNSPNVSIIGEDPANTSITNELPNSLSSNPDAGANGQANPLEGIRTSGVLYLQGNATDTYFQDIKLWSATADATGRNVVLVDGGNRNIYKNVTLWAYQDTYVPDNSKGLTYYEGGIVRGRTDFICGSGDVFFNQVQLVMCQDGGYISVPRDNVKYGFVYKDCTIKGETSKVDGNYFLGRAWTAAAESYFINTIMEAVPRAEGWSDWNNGPTRFAEFNSMTASGTPIDLSSRKSQFASDGSVNNPVLTADEALEIGNLHNMFGDWDPTLATEQAPVPANVKLKGNVLTWTNSEYALLYAIVKDGKVVAFTTEPTYTVDDTDATWAVRAANEMGGLGEAAKADVTVGINEMTNEFNDVPERIYNINGIRVDKAAKGLYIVNGKKVVVK